MGAHGEGTIKMRQLEILRRLAQINVAVLLELRCTRHRRIDHQRFMSRRAIFPIILYAGDQVLRLAGAANFDLRPLEKGFAL